MREGIRRHEEKLSRDVERRQRMFESSLKRSGTFRRRNVRKDMASTKLNFERERDSLNTEFERILQQ